MYHHKFPFICTTVVWPRTPYWLILLQQLPLLLFNTDKHSLHGYRLQQGVSGSWLAQEMRLSLLFFQIHPSQNLSCVVENSPQMHGALNFSDIWALISTWQLFMMVSCAFVYTCCKLFVFYYILQPFWPSKHAKRNTFHFPAFLYKHSVWILAKTQGSF